jgi:hypothetical protein
MRNNRGLSTMVIAALVGGVWLFFFANQVAINSRPAPERPNEIIHEQIVKVYASQALIAFAKSHDPWAITTNTELIGRLEQAKLQNSWFVKITRAHHAQGEILDTLVIVRPGQHESMFPTTIGVFRTLAGEPPGEYFAEAQIVVIPQSLLTKDPREVLDELFAL